MAENSGNKARTKASPEETGGILYYLVGSRTDEFLSDKELVEKIGLGEADRDELYLEMAIILMFIMINQYSRWEKDQAAAKKALDRMHFLLFHQLKEYSNYDEDDVEQLHRHILDRYEEYGDALENNEDISWLKVLAEAFLDNLNEDFEDKESSINLLAKNIDKYYKSIPNLLESI